MKTRLALCILFALASLTQLKAQSSYQLNPLSSFGRADGSVRPGDAAYVDSGFNQRGLAYDHVTGNLVYVDTHSGSSGSSSVTGAVYVLDGTTGLQTSTLSTNGISGGSYADVGAVIADDGVVYVCNQVNVSTNLAFKIYRWDSVSDPNPPIIAFNAIMPGVSQRYGTSIDVRGSGAGTQIIFGSMPGTTATNV